MTRRREIDEAQKRIDTEGARVAVAALIEVCRDTKAPAPARATAGTSLLRAAGFFDRTTREDDSKDASEMTAEQIQRRIAQLQAEMEGPTCLLPDESEDDQPEDEDNGPVGLLE